MADRRTRKSSGKKDDTSGEVVVHQDGVTISGPEGLVEDFLDGQEIDRRLGDPANQQPIPWSELKARRGLWSVLPAYEVVALPAIAKDLERLPRDVETRVSARIDALAKDPQLSGAQSIAGHPRILPGARR